LSEIPKELHQALTKLNHRLDRVQLHLAMMAESLPKYAEWLAINYPEERALQRKLRRLARQRERTMSMMPAGVKPTPLLPSIDPEDAEEERERIERIAARLDRFLSAINDTSA
jgi:hypothetical protein